MARPVQSKQQEQSIRQQLCQTALALYRARGYEAVTLREVGAAAGVSHATPYGYFSSKEDLFVHIRAQLFRELGEFLQAGDRISLPPLPRVHRLAMTLAKFGRTRPDDYRLLFSHRQAAAPTSSPLARARREALAFAVSILQSAIDAGDLEGDAMTQAHLIWASLHGLLSLHVSKHLVNGRRLDDLVGPMIDGLLAPRHSLTSKSRRAPTRPRTARR